MSGESIASSEQVKGEEGDEVLRPQWEEEVVVDTMGRPLRQ
jgi:hypothetical protein